MTSIDHAARTDQAILPICRLKAFRAHPLPLAGTMDKLAIAGIKTRMQTARSLPVFKHKNISWQQSILGRDKPARPRLIRCNTGHVNALLAVGPLDKTGAVKTLDGRIAAKPVARTYLRIRAFNHLFRRNRCFCRHCGPGALGAAAGKAPYNNKAQEQAAKPHTPCWIQTGRSS